MGLIPSFVNRAARVGRGVAP